MYLKCVFTGWREKAILISRMDYDNVYVLMCPII